MLQKSSLLFVFLLLCLPAAIAQAQFTVPSEQTAALELSPQYPQPESEVKVSISAYSYNTQGATINWYLDGVVLSSEQNERNITITTPELGQSQTVTAVVTLIDGEVLSLSQTITPSRIDLIVEADTLTPIHYAGRALPSSGSRVRLIALPQTNVSPDALSYQWEVDRTVLNGGPVTGKNVATFEMPNGRGVLVTLVVGHPDGSILTRRVFEVPAYEPQIRFYTVNPLRGMSQTVLPSPFTLFDEEITVRAEPYYMAANIFSEEHIIEWDVDGRSVDNPSVDQQEITLRRSGAEGNFPVEFHIRNLRQLLQGARESFVIRF